MAYEIRWQLWEVPLPESALRVWQKDRVRDAAQELISQRAKVPCNLSGRVQPVLGQELRDWVLRGGEKFMPLPDHVLDAYWRAHRGVPGFYDPLLLGLKAKRYLGLGSSGEIGEGIALSVVETPAPDGLGYMTICRPLGTSPDFICQDLRDETTRPLVEVKTTELSGEIDRCLVDGVQTVLDVYRAWQRHRPLKDTPGLAVAVHLGQNGFDVDIIRLRFGGKELVELRPQRPVEASDLQTAKKAVWATIYDEAACALDRVLANQPADVVENELATLVEVRKVSIGAMAVRNRELVEKLPRGKGKSQDSKHQRRESIREFIEDRGVTFDADAVKVAEELAEEVHQLRLEEDARSGRGPDDDWSDEGGIGDWRYVVQPRADGVELRAFRLGARRVDLAHVTRALAALESSGGARGRHRQGHAAVAAWVDGVEWAAFVDGRIQGWIPEVENVRNAGGELARQVEKMIWAWEAGLVGGGP